MYLIDPCCDMLIKGFKYGYRYRKRRNGEFEDRPEKNEWSHVHDANQYADSVIDMSARGEMHRTAKKEVKKVKYLY